MLPLNGWRIQGPKVKATYQMPHSQSGQGEFTIQVTHEAKVIDELSFLVPGLRTQTLW